MTRFLCCCLLVVTTFALTLVGGKPVASNPPAAPPVQAVVPYNAAVYNGPPGITPEQTKRLLALLESIDGKLDYLQSIDEKLTEPGAKAKGAPRVTWQQVVPTKCASCHNPTLKKGDFIMTNEDGKTAKPLNAREWLKVVEAVESDHMPPPEKPRLKADEKAAFKKK